MKLAMVGGSQKVEVIGERSSKYIGLVYKVKYINGPNHGHETEAMAEYVKFISWPCPMEVKHEIQRR